MTTLRFDDLKQYSDVLRSRSGSEVTVRFVEPRDIPCASWRLAAASRQLANAPLAG